MERNFPLSFASCQCRIYFIQVPFAGVPIDTCKVLGAGGGVFFFLPSSQVQLFEWDFGSESNMKWNPLFVMVQILKHNRTIIAKG